MATKKPLFAVTKRSLAAAICLVSLLTCVRAQAACKQAGQPCSAISADDECCGSGLGCYKDYELSGGMINVYTCQQIVAGPKDSHTKACCTNTGAGGAQDCMDTLCVNQPQYPPNRVAIGTNCTTSCNDNGNDYGLNWCCTEGTDDSQFPPNCPLWGYCETTDCEYNLINSPTPALQAACAQIHSAVNTSGVSTGVQAPVPETGASASGGCSYQSVIDACKQARGPAWDWTCEELTACNGADFCGEGTVFNGQQCIIPPT